MFYAKYLIIILAFILHKTDSEYQKLKVTANGKLYSKLTGVYKNTNQSQNGHVYYKKSDGMEAYVYFNKASRWVIGKSLKKETTGNTVLGGEDPPQKGWAPPEASIVVKGIGKKETHLLRAFPEFEEGISKNGTNINFFGELINVSIFAAGCSGAAIVLEIFLCGFCIYCVKRRRNKKTMRKLLEMEAKNKDVSTSFPHVLLVKDKDLKENSVAYATDIENLKMEFRLLVRYVERNVPPGLSYSDAMEPDNFDHHNRYKDILPFNHNRIVLSKDLGKPPTTYINASKITFYGLKQNFYAVMAPKVNSIQNFWQLVIDKQIGVIVMITALKEGNKIKSAQYWPDKDNANIELPNCKLKYESHTYPGTYFHRKFSLDAGEGPRTVHQLQTNAWKDKTAPSRSKILLDLVYKTQELVEENPGPILVHCSAGVGRSGTFLALYKLADDYSNHNVQVLDIANTVLEMRRQRVKMVQKKEQYVYIAQCLSHYISAQEADYQEA